MNNQILVNNIKKLCKENNVSISALEKELYMSPGLISRWTKNTPALDRIIEIANYFNVSVDILIGNTNNDSNDNIKNINRLLAILYNKTRDAEIKWIAFNSQYTEESIVNKKISSIVEPNVDCFYCNVNGGNFILRINYNEDWHNLSLYILADPNSTPKLICSDYEKLYNLYNYLFKIYGEQLNDIKTNNFINEFINQNNTPSSTKIAVLKDVING